MASLLVAGFMLGGSVAGLGPHQVAFASYSQGGLFVSDPGQCDSNSPPHPTGSPAVGQNTCVLVNYDTTNGDNVYLCYSVSSANSTGGYSACHLCSFIGAGTFNGFDFSCIIPPVNQGYTVSYYAFVDANTIGGGSPPSTVPPNDPTIVPGANQTSANAISYSFSGTAAAYSRLHRSGRVIIWYSTQHVLGFNVFDGKQKLNHRLVTSKTHTYRFVAPNHVRHLRLQAVWPNGSKTIR